MLKKILIADGSEEFRLSLTDELQDDFTIHSCGDGQQALELLRTYRPDFLVMDLLICGIDGLTVLQTATNEGICPPTLVTTVFSADYVVNSLQQFDVVYMMLKPCCVSALSARIRDWVSQAPAPLFLRPSPESLITAALVELNGVPGRHGFHYCREAALMLHDNPTLQVTKHIYPAIAKEYGVTKTSVEKAIRDFITGAYANRNDAVWRRYFLPAPSGQIPKPSNRVFLTTLVEVIFSINEAAR